MAQKRFRLYGEWWIQVLLNFLLGLITSQMVSLWYMVISDFHFIPPCLR